jgi:hypothetical protein
VSAANRRRFADVRMQRIRKGDLMIRAMLREWKGPCQFSVGKRVYD